MVDWITSIKNVDMWSHTWFQPNTEYAAQPYLGNHGFDNADFDMRAMFMAVGPGTYRSAVCPPRPLVEGRN